MQSDMQPILEVSHITKTFHEHGGRRFCAVNDISLTVRPGECVGIVGESGSGKSTLARIVTRLVLPDSGSVKLCGTELTTAKGAALRAAYRNIKMIFQEPRSSFDPRLTLGESICEALKLVMPDKKARREEAGRLLCSVSWMKAFSAFTRDRSAAGNASVPRSRGRLHKPQSF
ncbi:ATP-binding cassette domain-containing protein [Clostridium sp. OF09-36]|uniref:ATP-binding cassette domain-containing protein n=1 Tax=Clostridium sp. OF09-36 TaxID=2292310 RepID=UPI0024323B5F|nr:ATP-binding cassette domain-containing protein [Clostridium sp. OF09-36]